MRASVGVGLLLVAHLVAPRATQACGGFFADVSSSVVTMSDIRVLLVREKAGGYIDMGAPPDRLHQYVQIAYQGDAGRFAWVYPVAANPEVVEADSPFPALESRTTPRITIHSSSPSQDGGGMGCLCGGDDSASGPGDQLVPPAVKVWQSGQVGAFDYVVITAASAQTLLDWLTSNGFKVPGSAAPVLDHYVSLGWFFVAMKVSVQKTAAAVPSTTTVRLSHALPAEAPLRYPLRMVSLSPAKELSLEIFVASPDGAVPQSPFSHVRFPAGKLRARSRSTHNYDAVFQEAARSGPRVLVLEYASWERDALSVVPHPVGPVAVLARFRAVLAPSAMDQDLLFERGSTDQLLPDYYLTYSGTSTDGRAAGMPTPLAALALVWLIVRELRRRRSRTRSPAARSREDDRRGALDRSV